MGKIKWLSGLLLILNVVFGVLLLLSISSLYINPNDWWIPSILGLGFLQLFFLNLFFSFIWLFFKRKYLWFSLFFLVFGLTELPNHLQFNLSSKSIAPPTRILSLNVRNFDLYNWSENKKTRDRIIKTIQRAKSDIICLQEFFNTTDPKHDFNTLDTILQSKKKYNYHVEYTATVKETEHWGIATFTSYPIISKGRITFENKSNNICIYTDVLIKNDTVRVYNMHLASVKFGQEDYSYLKKIGVKVEEDVTGLTNLVRKLRPAFLTRAEQALAVKKHMRESPYPIVLCGDFNDTPTSFTYSRLCEGLKDSFKAKGSGFGATYNGNLPFLRIDYVMADPEIRILKHEVIHTDISDHYPVIVNIEIPD